MTSSITYWRSNSLEFPFSATRWTVLLFKKDSLLFCPFDAWIDQTRRMLNSRDEYRALAGGVLIVITTFFTLRRASECPVARPGCGPGDLYGYIRNCTKLFVSGVSPFPPSKRALALLDTAKVGQIDLCY